MAQTYWYPTACLLVMAVVKLTERGFTPPFDEPNSPLQRQTLVLPPVRGGLIPCRQKCKLRKPVGRRRGRIKP